MSKININDIPVIDEAKGNTKKEYKNMEKFFPSEDYKVPASPSNYMRFQDGINRIRIMSSAIIGYEYFTTENKPVRSREAFEDPPEDIKTGGVIKHFWCFVVWSYETEKIQILELTQKTIMNPIKALVDNKKWGNPHFYDIAINKTGDNMETKYNTQAEPPIGEPDKKIVEAYSKVKINLEALYDGNDPYEETK